MLLVLALGASAYSALPEAPATPGADPAPAVSPAAVVASPASPPTSLTPTIAVDGGTPVQRAQLDDALALFAAAGLALPDLEVAFHADEGPCNGHLGLFRSSTTPWRVDVCSDLPFVPAHELAHAWLDAHVDEATRDALLEATGLPAWRDTDADWDQLGVERAAFVVQQVLMASGGRLSDEWAARHAEYELLTGGPVPGIERWDGTA